MKISNTSLFIISAIIWGSTWYAITFQLGKVDPLVSAGYRFAIAGVLMLGFCKIFKLPLQFSLKTHLMMALMGAILFGLNYWLVYLAETSIVSGLVALIFSTMIFFNILFNRMFLKASIKPRTLTGGLLGLAGTFLIFRTEILGTHFTGPMVVAFILCMSAVILASLGNIISASQQKKQVPVIQANAFGMSYGAIINFIIALALGKEFNFDMSTGYIVSLSYLAIFGSIIAFAAYLKLVGRIGPDQAVYVSIITPVMALLISTFLEDFHWSIYSLSGALLIITGNYVALRKKQLHQQAPVGP